MTNYLTVKDIQDRLHISKNTAYRLVNKKGFPVTNVCGKKLIPEEEFERYMLNHIHKK